MEEDGDEEDIKTIKKDHGKLPEKVNQLNKEQTAVSLSHIKDEKVKKDPVVIEAVDSDEENGSSVSDEAEGIKVMLGNKQTQPDVESSEENLSDNDEIAGDNSSKYGKSVSFSPSIEFSDETIKSPVDQDKCDEKVINLAPSDINDSNEKESLDVEEVKIQDDEIHDENFKEKQDDESKEKINETEQDQPEINRTLETEEEVLDSKVVVDDDGSFTPTPEQTPSDDLQESSQPVSHPNEITSETIQPTQNQMLQQPEIASPGLPPRNANGTSPSTPPKPESSTTKKILDSSIVSAVKKMVEAPIKFIKSKKDTKAPSRKRKIEIGPPIPIPENENHPFKVKSDTASPPLPPRNKTNANLTSPLLKNGNGVISDPEIDLRTGESPKLPSRNKLETAFISSPPSLQQTDKELENIAFKNYISDDPKRFCSLQVKKNNGCGRTRESSLPPPNCKEEDGRKSPKVPPKTWMWEELRRNKVKGGYPWTHLNKGSFDETKWKEIMEHEYEYVDPRPELLRPEPIRPQVTVRVTPSPEPEKPKQQRRFIRIKDTDQVIIPLHGSSDEEHNPDRYDDLSLVGQEEIGETPAAFRPSPSPIPSRRKSSPEIKLSEKLKTTAGQIGSKIRKISIPDKSKIKLPDKPKFIADIQQMKLPDKPKFLTEKPKFLTEKPKFLTEKPKFLTEKPKFLTEKPKFLTEKPKFLTEKPKFLTEKPKFLTEKPKFLSEKPKFLREGIKFPERPKINMPSLSLPRPKRMKKRDTSVKSEFGSEKNIFHTIKARTYPRFLNKKKKQGNKKATPPPGQAKFDSESLPSTPRSKRNDKWTDVYKGKGLEEDVKVASYSNGESFHERYRKKEAKRASSSSLVDSDREQASSGSSTQRHRAGVIEEIDSDEFFVRVKGISREDVQVSHYLSSEIREAFRSPKNALASLDKDDFDDEEPLPPNRSKKPKQYPKRKEFNTFPLRPSRSNKARGKTMEKPPRRFKEKSKPGSLPSLDRERDLDIEDIVAIIKEPPMPPKRRKSTKDLPPQEYWDTTHQVPDEDMALEDVKVEYDTEPPMAPMRKARSHGTSLADEDRTSRGAESIKSDIQMEDELDDDLHMETGPRSTQVVEKIEIPRTFPLNESIVLERSSIQETPGYSNILKTKPPPRPPLPDNKEPVKEKTLPHQRFKTKLLGSKQVQQLQSWKNQGVNFFFTYPRRAMSSINKVPKRPVRNYSTIAGPTRPPRRHKVFREPVYVDADVDPIDSIPFIDDEEKLKSSRSEETIGGMKGRPLPPPPRPSSPPKLITTTLEDKTNIESMNSLNDLAGDSNSLETPDKSSGKLDDASEKMQSRPLPPPPRKKRGSTSTERRKDSISEETKILNDLNEKEGIDVRMTIDISEPISIVAVHHAEHVKTEDEKTKLETPIRSNIERSNKVTSEVSQQTSLEVAEITVSVQTDPLPDGAIVEETDDTSSFTKPHESDEEPTIEKYLEKYGSEIKMLGRQIQPAKPTQVKLQDAPTDELENKSKNLEEIEKDIIPSKSSLSESERNIDTGKSKIIEKTVSIQKDKLKKEKEKPDTDTFDKPVSFPDRLHLSQLDVDNLNVSTLKASQIVVSDLSGQSIQVAELTSKGGNLVVSGMEFPPSFIQSLASEISAKVEENIPQRALETPQVVEAIKKVKEKTNEIQLTPLRPQKLTVVTAPPAVIVQPSAESYKLPTPEVGTLSPSDNIPTPRTTRNKGKKSSRNDSSRIVDDSEDELASTMASSRPSSARSSPVRQIMPSTSQHPAQQSSDTATSGLSARQLLIELLKIWKDCVSEGFSACSNTLGAMFPEGNKRRDAQKAACVLFVIIIGLFALGFGTDNTVHYHHWDYVPPRM